MIETCFQVLPGRGQVRALRAALRAPWNASSLLIGRHRALRDARSFLPACPRFAGLFSYPHGESCCLRVNITRMKSPVLMKVALGRVSLPLRGKRNRKRGRKILKKESCNLLMLFILLKINFLNFFFFLHLECDWRRSSLFDNLH